MKKSFFIAAIIRESLAEHGQTSNMRLSDPVKFTGLPETKAGSEIWKVGEDGWDMDLFSINPTYYTLLGELTNTQYGYFKNELYIPPGDQYVPAGSVVQQIVEI